MLPAGDGDCLLAQTMNSAGVATTTILIDGGREETYITWKPIIQSLVGSREIVDLVVITHIDADHIGGIIAMLSDDDRGFAVGGIWFNGHPQIVAAQASDLNREAYGVAQADALSGLVERLALPWNEIFDGGPIHSGTTITDLCVGEFAITVVTPSRNKLALMLGPWAKAWEAAIKLEDSSSGNGVERYGSQALNIRELATTADENDTAKPNGSSIGLILEAFGRRLLLAGDCHPADLAAALVTLARPVNCRTSVDILKVSHHGARKNTTNAMLNIVEASTYAFSTDGSRHQHPDYHTVAKVIVSGSRAKMLAFNYRTLWTAHWDDPNLKREFAYETQFADEKNEGHLCINLPGI